MNTPDIIFLVPDPCEPHGYCWCEDPDPYSNLEEFESIEYAKVGSPLYHVLEAAKQTLLDNLHLCDGDVCTLKELRDAVSVICPGWDRPQAAKEE